MQKIISLSLVILISFLSFSCKSDKKVDVKKQYELVAKTTTINWTAFKTTKKIPVKGVFKTINLINNKVANTVIQAINNVEFSIPVNSIETKDKTRDAKIITSFFGTMKGTSNLIGKVHLTDNGKGSVNLRMNAISKDFPITYVISGQVVEINASINLDNWQAKLAIDALNLVCKDLHKGEDGVSKTWNQVDLNIVTYLKVD